MNKREIRYHLHNLDGLHKEMKRIQAEIDSFNSMDIDYIIVSVISDMPRTPGSTITSKVENKAIQRVEYVNKLKMELAKIIMIQSAIYSVLNCIRPNSFEHQVISMRYFAGQGECNKLEYIASKLKKNLKDVQKSEHGTICKIYERHRNQLMV